MGGIWEEGLVVVLAKSRKGEDLQWRPRMCRKRKGENLLNSWDGVLKDESLETWTVISFSKGNCNAY